MQLTNHAKVPTFVLVALNVIVLLLSIANFVSHHQFIDALPLGLLIGFSMAAVGGLGVWANYGILMAVWSYFNIHLLWDNPPGLIYILLYPLTMVPAFFLESRVARIMIGCYMAAQVLHIYLFTKYAYSVDIQFSHLAILATVFVLILYFLYSKLALVIENRSENEKKELRQYLETQNRSLLQKNNNIQALFIEMKKLNSSLEEKVALKTKTLELQNRKLREYSFSNSHVLRAPLTRVMGLIKLIEHEKNYDHALVNLILSSSEELDSVIKKINDSLQEETITN